MSCCVRGVPIDKDMKKIYAFKDREPRLLFGRAKAIAFRVSHVCSGI